MTKAYVIAIIQGEAMFWFLTFQVYDLAYAVTTYILEILK